MGTTGRFAHPDGPITKAICQQREPMEWQNLLVYIDHFLPREVTGPVVIVFSRESVVDGVFNLYVPAEYALLGWTAIFLLSIVGVAYWGTTDEKAVEGLQQQIEELQAE